MDVHFVRPFGRRFVLATPSEERHLVGDRSSDLKFRLRMGWMVPVQDGILVFGSRSRGNEHEKGVRWMPWHQEAMKDVARCEKPWGAASRR